MNSSSPKHKKHKRLLTSSFDRRTFIQKALISTSSLALYGCGGGSSSGGNPTVPTPQPPPAGDTPGQVLERGRPAQNIIIIGAGIAGMVAAYEMSQAGHEVVILEARERSGGRVHTLFSPFADSQFTEAGASRIPSNHQLTLEYADHFSLSLETFYPTSGDYFSLINNQIQRINPTQYIGQPPWPGSVNRSAYRKIVGGMSQLPNAFENFLSSRISFSSPVTLVQQDTNSVTVTTQTGEMFVADRLLCTTPVPVLNRIAFDPGLSSNKQNAINGDYRYTDSSRLYTQFSNRLWLDNNYNGWGDTDLEEVWQPTWNQSGSSGIIQSYLRGLPAEVFDSLPLAEQIASVHGRWRQILPNLDDFIINNHIFSWQDEEWSGSAFASPTNSQETNLKSALSAVEGRIHFAGEHASNNEGWIQGALESGIRAAKEINQSV